MKVSLRPTEIKTKKYIQIYTIINIAHVRRPK